MTLVYLQRRNRHIRQCISECTAQPYHPSDNQPEGVLHDNHIQERTTHLSSKLNTLDGQAPTDALDTNTAGLNTPRPLSQSADPLPISPSDHDAADLQPREAPIPNPNRPAGYIIRDGQVVVDLASFPGLFEHLTSRAIVPESRVDRAEQDAPPQYEG